MRLNINVILLIFILLILAMRTSPLQSETIAEAPSNYNDYNVGTAENPFLIANLANLRWLSETADVWGDGERYKYFLQTADIDATETESWNYGQGFIPIALNPMMINREIDGDPREFERVEFTVFSGNFNGGNHLISNLYINAISVTHHKNVGFFAVVDSTTISNVRLENIRIYSNQLTGGLVGTAMNNSLITHSSVSGTIMTGNYAGAVGGLVAVLSNSKIENSSASVILDSSDDIKHFEVMFMDLGHTGGLVARAIDSHISNSFFNGAIRRQGYITGGLVGTNNGLIYNSYVATSETIVIQSRTWDLSDRVDFMDKFVLHTQVGAISGSMTYGSEAINTFYCRQSTGLRKGFADRNIWLGCSSNSATRTSRGFNANQMKREATFTRRGWDFENVWDIDPDVNNGFPFLRK